jgi:non-ribosomal peptide synthetase component F
MIPLRVRLGGAATAARQVLDRTSATVRAALPHTALPFDELVRALRPQRRDGEAPYGQFLFEVNQLPAERSTADGVRWGMRWLPSRAPKFRVSLSWDESEAGWTQRLEYDAAHVGEEQARRLLDEVERHARRLGDLDAVFAEPVAERLAESASAATASAPAAPPPAPAALRAFLAELWCTTLGLPEIEDTDNFVELGGYSLAAIKIMIGIATQHGRRLPTHVIFDCDTFADFAAHVAHALDEERTPDAQL